MKNFAFTRYEKNPILEVKDVPNGAAYYILNPGAAKFKDEYILIVDVFHREGGIIFWIARSKNGIDFKFDEQPVKFPECGDGWVEHGMYDPRITQIGEDYFIVYNSHNKSRGTRLAIVKTRDFENYEHVSLMSHVNNRNGALFPEKINGLYCCFNRPFAGDEHSACAMELSFSPDLVFWGKTRASLMPRETHWDGLKVGTGAPPIRIKEGWLEIYHGVTTTCSGSIYSLHAAILDYKEPWKVLARTKAPLLFPEMPYERIGRADNIVFTCNALLEGDNVRMYYSCADNCIGLAELPLSDIVEACYADYQYLPNMDKN